MTRNLPAVIPAESTAISRPGRPHLEVVDVTVSGGACPTLGDLWDFYYANHARLHCRSHHAMSLDFNRYLAHWRDRPASTIRHAEVVALHTELGNRIGQPTANHAIQLLRAVFNRAWDWELFTGKNPAARVKLFHLESRDRFFDRDEIQRLLVALGQLRYEPTRDSILMALFTGARQANVRSMRWDQVNLDTGLWLITSAESKNRRSQYVPLVPAALDVLARRQRDNSPGCPWVFPAQRDPQRHVKNTHKAWHMTLERAGITNARLHDLRRTMGSWEAMIGANVAVIQQSLNHRDTRSTMVYARLQVEPVREVMTKATEAMLPAGVVESLNRYSKPVQPEPVEDSPALAALFVDDTVSLPTAARMLGIRSSCLHNWRRKNQGPPWQKRGEFIRYKRQDVLDFLNKEAAQAEAQAAAQQEAAQLLQAKQDARRKQFQEACRLKELEETAIKTAREQEKEAARTAREQEKEAARVTRVAQDQARESARAARERQQRARKREKEAARTAQEQEREAARKAQTAQSRENAARRGQVQQDWIAQEVARQAHMRKAITEWQLSRTRVYSDDDAVDVYTAAEILKKPVSVLTIWRGKRQGPTHHKTDGVVMYFVGHLRAWLEDNAPGSAPAKVKVTTRPQPADIQPAGDGIDWAALI